MNSLQTQEGYEIMDKFEVTAVIKYSCEKGMSRKKISDDFVKTLGDEYPSYSRVKKWAANLEEEGRAAKTMKKPA